MKLSKLFLVFFYFTLTTFAQDLPYQTLDSSKFVFALDLQDSLKQYSKVLEQFNIPNFSDFNQLLQTTDQTVYLEFNELGHTEIWIQHQDEKLTREDHWVHFLSQFIGKASHNFIDGIKYWEFKGARHLLFRYEEHELRFSTKSSKKGNRKKEEAFFWKSHETPILKNKPQNDFPKFSLWSDYSYLVSNELPITHKILSQFGLQHASSFQSLGIVNNSIHFSHRTPIDKSNQFSVNPIIPQKSVQWHQPELIPPDPDIYCELTSSDYSNLLDQIRSMVYAWGDRPGKEFDSDLLLYEEKYKLSVKEDLLQIFMHGASLAFYRPEHPNFNQKKAIWASTLKLSNKNMLLNLMDRFPKTMVQHHQSKDPHLHYSFSTKKSETHIYWKDQQLYLSNHLKLIQQMLVLKDTEISTRFHLPPKLNAFHLKPSGFGHRVFLNHSLLLQLIEGFVDEELSKSKLLPKPFLDSYKPLAIEWLKQQKYWAFAQLNHEPNTIHLDLWVDRTTEP